MVEAMLFGTTVPREDAEEWVKAYMAWIAVPKYADAESLADLYGMSHQAGETP